MNTLAIAGVEELSQEEMLETVGGIPFLAPLLAADIALICAAIALLGRTL